MPYLILRDDIEERINACDPACRPWTGQLQETSEIVRAYTLDCMDEHLTVLTGMLFPAS
jgi:hypothetical protein